jgi:WD40 repeat protein
LDDNAVFWGVELPLKKRGELKGHAGPVYALCKGRSEQTVFSGSSDGFVAEWNYVLGQVERFSINTGSPIFSLCHVPEKQLLVVGHDNGDLRFVDLAQRQELKLIRHQEKGIFSIVFDAQYQRLYSISGDGRFCAWDAADFRLLIDLPISLEKLRCLVISASHHLFIGCSDGDVVVLEPEFFNEVHRFRAHDLGVNSLVFCGANDFYTGGKDAFLHHYQWLDNSIVLKKKIPAHNYAIYGLCADENSGFVFSCSRDKTLKVFSTPLDFIQRIDRKDSDGHKSSVNALYLDKEKKLLVSTGDDRAIITWMYGSL